MVVDRFSNMLHFIPLPKLPSTKGTAEAVLSHLFHLHGFPAYVVSDRGTHPVSVLEGVMQSLRSNGRLVLRLSPTIQWADGAFEPGAGERPSLSVVPKPHFLVEYAHNTLPSISSGRSTFQCSNRYQPPLFPALERESRVPLLLPLHLGTSLKNVQEDGGSATDSSPQLSGQPKGGGYLHVTFLFMWSPASWR